MAAGVAATAPAAVTMGAEGVPAFSNVAVQPASFVTDLLYNAGDVVNSVANAVLIGTDAALGLNFYLDDYDYGWGVPFNPLFAAVVGLQNPSGIGSLLSYVAQTYLNPSYNYAYYSYPYYLNDLVLQPLAGVLPAPLNSAVSNAINGVADSINNIFSNLPDPTAAVDAMWDLYSSVPGRLTYAAQYTLSLPVQLAATVAYWAAYLPADLEATAESAIQNPSQIPGLISNLIYGALDPNLGDGMLGGLLYSVAKPFFFLPAPIGESSVGAADGFAYNAYSGIVNAISGLLSVLPAPITPTPFAAAAPAAVPAAAAGARDDADAAATDSAPVAAKKVSAAKAGANSASSPATAADPAEESASVVAALRAGSAAADDEQTTGSSDSTATATAGDAAQDSDSTPSVKAGDATGSKASKPRAAATRGAKAHHAA
ncbi:hypothetical protein B1R94_03695 [Mycolicibacterium litorale]|nr:hypothetical protein B1R94_03695 [Mycolicibacterium litorale]